MSEEIAWCNDDLEIEEQDEWKRDGNEVVFQKLEEVKGCDNGGGCSKMESCATITHGRFHAPLKRLQKQSNEKFIEIRHI